MFESFASCFRRVLMRVLTHVYICVSLCCDTCGCVCVCVMCGVVHALSREPRGGGGREKERGRSYTLPLYHSRRCVKYHALATPGTRSSSVTECVLLAAFRPSSGPLLNPVRAIPLSLARALFFTAARSSDTIIVKSLLYIRARV